MAEERQDIKHKRGDKRILIFGPVVDKEAENGWADLSGSTAKWRMAKLPTSTGTDIYVTKTTAPSEGVTIVPEDYYGVTRYNIWVELEGTDTGTVPACVPPNRYWHELEIIDGDGDPSTIATGFFDLQPSILNQ